MNLDLFSVLFGLSLALALDVVALVWLFSSERLLDRTADYLEQRWVLLHERRTGRP